MAQLRDRFGKTVNIPESLVPA